jgi:hypothetical protein
MNKRAIERRRLTASVKFGANAARAKLPGCTRASEVAKGESA